VVDEARRRDRVSHPRRLVHFLALNEELHVAVDILSQGKIISQSSLVHLDLLVLVHGVVEVLGQVVDVEIVQNGIQISGLGGVHAVRRDGHRTLHDRLAAVSPFGLIIAHEEGTVRVEVDSADVEPHLLLSCKELFELNYDFSEGGLGILGRIKEVFKLRQSISFF